MTAAEATLTQHATPHRERRTALVLSFGLMGGPFAWFVQLCAGYAMASWPCFPSPEPLSRPPDRFAWTSEAIVIVSVAAILVALASFFVSKRILDRRRPEDRGADQQRLEIGAGRTRFLALWGMGLGAGSAVAIAINTVAFFVLPRCAG